MRNQFLSPGGRLKYGLGSLALPPLLLARGLITLIRKRRLVGKYLASLPMIVIYLTAGAAGEMVGYFLGAGDSLERIE
jgi:hypothetical protein